MLEGIRIIEFEGLGPGPFAGMMLADMGADVIVVHRKEPAIKGMPERNILDRGKRSVILNPKITTEQAQIKKLVASADGLIEGFRPGVMERLGLGPEVLQQENPRLVYGRMTGWGQDGPQSRRAGHDLNYIALSGALWYTSPPNTAPFPPPTLVGDIGGGAMYLVAGMLAGLLRAQRTGKGTVVDAAIVDGSAHMMNLLMSMQAAEMFRTQRGQSLLDGPHWSRCYACADGCWLSVQCLEPQFYHIFLEKLDLQSDEDFQQQHNMQLWPALSERLTALFASKPAAYWEGVFADTDACVMSVLSPKQAAEHQHMAARGTWVQENGPLQARAAPRFDGKVPDDPADSPLRGEHTTEILEELDSNASRL
ncbi:MAG: CaiB/BaiF CoA transferase family protein [Thiolinea sp.]